MDKQNILESYHSIIVLSFAMTDGTFEASEILLAHAHNLEEIIDNLISKKIGDGSPYKKFLRTEVGKQYKNYILNLNTIPEVNLPPEFSTAGELNDETMKSAVNDLDYYCNWLHLTEKHLNAFQTQTFSFDLRWGIPVTVEICQLFSYFIKTFMVLGKISNDISVVWALNRMTSKKTSCPKRFIDEVVISLRQTPLQYLRNHLSFMKDSLYNLIIKISPTFIQYFGLNSSFDWSILNGESTANNKATSTLSSTHLLVIQQLRTFRDLIFLYAIVFPDIFNDNEQIQDVLNRIIVACPIIQLSPLDSLSFGEISKRFPDQKNMNQTILDSEIKNFRKHTENKIRLNILISLLSDFESKILIDSTYLALKAEEICALLSASYFEILSCLAKDMDDPLILQLICLTAKIIQLYSKHKIEIQRIFLYSLVAIDVPYLFDLLSLFSTKCLSQDKPIISMIDIFRSSISKLELDDFDNGYRYDIYPLLLTHGRLIHYALLKQAGSSSYLHPVLEHMLVVRHHLEFFKDPTELVFEACPMWTFSTFLARIKRLFSSFDLATFISIQDIVTFFNYFPINSTTTKCLKPICEEFLSKIISILFESFDEKSIFSSIEKEETLDFDFSPEKYMPFVSNNVITDYTEDSHRMNRINNALQLAILLPQTIRYGDLVIEMRTDFLIQFFKEITKGLENSFNNPSRIRTLMYSIQHLKFIFNSYGITFTTTIFNAIRDHKQVDIPPALKNEELQEVVTKFPLSASSSPVLQSFLDQLKTFITDGFHHATYHPLGRKFYSKNQKQSSVEHNYGYESLRSIIESFGIEAGVRINSILNANIFKCISALFEGFQAFSVSDLPHAEITYFTDKFTDFSIFVNDNLRKSANMLIAIGTSIVLKEILSDAIKDTIDAMFPGLFDIIMSANQRCRANRIKITKKDQQLLEALSPSKFDYSLSELCIPICSAKRFNPSQFFFYLALLLNNDEWNDLTYNTVNDVFSFNLTMIPHAVKKIVESTDLFFTLSDLKEIEDGIKLFCLTTATILKVKKDKVQPRSYSAFTVLIDKCMPIVQSLHRNCLDREFPYFIFRNAYEHT